MARRAIVEYIAWYNGTRLHSTLSDYTPTELEAQDTIPVGNEVGASKEARHGQDQL